MEVKGKADSFEVPKTQLPISTEYCGEEKMVVVAMIIATFRSEYEYDYEYEFSVLSTRCWFKGRNFSKCACSELKTRTRSRPRTPI